MKTTQILALPRLAALSTVAAIALTAAPAQAQATRTWVSGVGNDADPCSRTAPCKTFSGAQTKTAAGGEINCLDPGGFGGITINKSLSIICQYTEGGALVSATNGITINATAADHVYLKGIDLHGTGTGLVGIRFLVGASLTVEDSLVRGFRGTNGVGIAFLPSGAATLTLRNVSVNNNGAGTGGGVQVQPSGAGSASVLIVNSQINNNTGNGLRASGVANVRVRGTNVFSNSTGISIAGGATIGSFGDNLVEANGVDGAFNGTVTNK